MISLHNKSQIILLKFPQKTLLNKIQSRMKYTKFKQIFSQCICDLITNTVVFYLIYGIQYRNSALHIALQILQILVTIISFGILIKSITSTLQHLKIGIFIFKLLIILILAQIASLDTSFILVCNLLQYHYQVNYEIKEDVSFNKILILCTFMTQINQSYVIRCKTPPLWILVTLLISHFTWFCFINYKRDQSMQEKISKPLVFTQSPLKQIIFQEDIQSMKEMSFQHSVYAIKDQLIQMIPWLDNHGYLIIDQNVKIIVDNLKLEPYICESMPETSKSGGELLDCFLDCTTEIYSSNLDDLLFEKTNQIKLSLAHLEPQASGYGLNDTKYRQPQLLRKIFSFILQQQSPSNQYLYTLFDIQSQYFDFQNKVLNFIIIHLEYSSYLLMWVQEVSNLQMNNQIEQKRQRYSVSTSKQQLNDSYSQQLITNIFSSVSHEFGTYLNCILAIATIGCSDSQISQEVQDNYFKPMRINGYLLNFILSNIRDFNQILLNQFALKICDFNIKEVIQDLLQELEMLFKSRNNIVIITVNSDYTNIFNDVERFKQILYQLLSNAIRFTQNGTITIEVSLIKDRYKDVIKISVSDTGIGMTKIEQGRLSELFKNSRKLVKVSSNSVGCGLGLSISNLIGQFLSGFHQKGIKFHSNHQKGSTFTFFLADSNALGNIESNLVISNSHFNQNCYYESQVSQSHDVKGVNQQSYRQQWKIQQFIGQQCQSNTDNQFSVVKEEDSQKQTKIQVSNIIQELELMGSQGSSKQSRLSLSQITESKLSENIIIPFQNYKTSNFVLKYDWKGKCCSRILIVDDEYFNILTLQMILKKYHTIIDFAFDGKQALERVKQKSDKCCQVCGNRGYTLYFLDINMPIMDGLETVKRLKAIMNTGELQRGVCIANTGFVDLETKLRCYNEGMDFYVSKPIKIQELEDFLENIFY